MRGHDQPLAPAMATDAVRSVRWVRLAGRSGSRVLFLRVPHTHVGYGSIETPLVPLFIMLLGRAPHLLQVDHTITANCVLVLRSLAAS